MIFFDIIKRDLIFYRRTQIVMGLLACICSVALTGALLVGDSVQHTLRQMAAMRLGRIHYACPTGDRFIRQELASQLKTGTESQVVPVLAIRGILESPDGTVRVNNINIYGVNDTFWQLGNSPSFPGAFKSADDAYVSESLALRLKGSSSDFLIRLQRPTMLSQDMIFSTEKASQAWNIKIAGTVPDDGMGRFSLQAAQEPPLNVFLPIHWVAEKIGQPKKANLLLVPDNWSSQDDLNLRLKECATLSDFGLEVHRIDEQNVLELRTPRIFLDGPIADAAERTGEDAYSVFTYFVNEIRFGGKSVPYSTVSAISTEAGVSILTDLKTNEIIINEWLAGELTADQGDTIELTYFQVTDTRKLIEQSAVFTVKQVVPMMSSFVDPTLMPDYPGLTEADSCSDWDSGVPIDLDRIKQRDEEYWDKYKGTPKAFISLKAAQTIWQNRFGTLTAVRWPVVSNSLGEISSSLKKNIDPSQIGITFRDVRETARQSAAGSTDFSGLFAGLSMFLIFSSALLLGLMFIFYIESRTEQVGLLLAVGWSRAKIFYLFLAEGASVALIGCLLGAVISVLYTSGLIFVLNASFWAKALASLRLSFHMTAHTLLSGIVISFLICVFAIILSLLRRVRRPVHQLLTGIFERHSKARSSRGLFLSVSGLFCLLSGMGISIKSNIFQSRVAVFFIAGTLCLIAFVLCILGFFKWMRFNSTSFVRSIKSLAMKSIPRKTGRSLAVIITLACGVFMVVGVGANYKDIGDTARQRSSGTGGFVLLARTTLPVTEPLELKMSEVDNAKLSLASDAFVPMRIYQQEDASCLNLNRSQQPTLLGVQPEQLAQRNAFSFQQARTDIAVESKWQLLNVESEDETIPAIGDYATVFWGLGKKLGDTISYDTETGDPVQLKIVGILKDSLLQGRLLISEKNFVHYFPSEDGYRQFLIDANWDRQQLQAVALTRKYRDVGMEVVSARQMLARYHEVENTYLAIFLVLGGLGVVLGSAALGLILVLNVLDRQGELAMMQAVGFQKRTLSQMLTLEHSILLLAGLLCGLIPALWAVLPSIAIQGGHFPYIKIMLIAVAILINGVVWTRIAVTGLLNTDCIQLLRNE